MGELGEDGCLTVLGQIDRMDRGLMNWKKLLWVPLWSGLTTAWLVLSLFLLLGMNEGESLQNPEVIVKQRVKVPEFVYAAVPKPESEIKAAVLGADAREEILRQYLERYGSPLLGLEDVLVEVADENGFDFRWMVAIAQQESNLCKKIPDGSHNCWGWGIWCLDYDAEANKCNEMKVTKFESYEQAIRKIAPQFKEKFLTKGEFTDPEQVMQTYTPPSKGSWAFGVNQFMEEME